MENEAKTEETVYKVRAENLGLLEAAFAKLNKRAKKLGVEPVTYECREIEKVAVKKKGKPTGEVKVYHHMVVIGLPVVKLGGWAFVATIDGSETVKPIIKAAPGQELTKEERGRAVDAPEECDHCKIARKRNKVFVVRNEEEGTKQVGSTCLKDFLGHNVTRVLATLAFYELVTEVMEEGDGEEGFGGGGGTGKPCWDLATFLAITAATIRQFGWVSRAVARDSYEPMLATADGVTTTLDPSLEQRATAQAFMETITEGDRETAKKAIEWVPEFEEKEVGDYSYNLAVITEGGFVTYKTAGLAASIVAAYQRVVEKELKRKEFAKKLEGSEHIGEIKKRMELGECTVMSRKVWEGDYGMTTMLKFVTEDGNALVWFASKVIECEPGDVFKVKATIKAHKEYQGIKETAVNRAVLTEVG